MGNDDKELPDIDPNGLFPVRSISERPAPATPIPAKPEMPLEAATDSREVGPIVTEAGISLRFQFRGTKRKAGRFAPNCFGSQSRHDPESSDCRSCRFLEGCKSTVVNEIPILRAASEARKKLFLVNGQCEPTAAALKQEPGGSNFYREDCLAKFQKDLKKRRQKDRAYRQEKRANPSAEMLIKQESKKRLAVLRAATARPRGDKQLEQFRGRERMIMAVWEAQQHARSAHGAAASAAKVARAFNEMVGADCLSRDQARTYQGHFRSLEQLSHVWKRFVTSPDEKSA